MDDLEKVSPPKIGGTLPHDENIRVLYSIAKSLKRIADHLDKQSTAARTPGAIEETGRRG